MSRWSVLKMAPFGTIFNKKQVYAYSTIPYALKWANAEY